eukprot:1160048-Pelagomonas_calceolata.AAC.11
MDGPLFWKELARVTDLGSRVPPASVTLGQVGVRVGKALKVSRATFLSICSLHSNKTSTIQPTSGEPS